MCDSHIRHLTKDAVLDSDNGRRNFLSTALVGGVTGLYYVLQPTVARAGSADALLLSCMDYRLTDDIVRYMDGRGMTDKYDHVILAGASLGALTDAYSAWGTTFRDHLQVAIKLHGIHKVIVMDHRDCGAYKTILGEDFVTDRENETLVHTGYLSLISLDIGRIYPDIEVETLLMDINGEVENIST